VLDKVLEQLVWQAVLVRPLRVTEHAVQVLLVRGGALTFLEKRRAPTIVLMVFVFFLAASVVVQEPLIVAVFFFWLLLFGRGLIKAARALKRARLARMAVVNPELLDQLLFGRRAVFPQPARASGRLRRAKISLILGVFSIGALVILFASGTVPVKGTAVLWTLAGVASVFTLRIRRQMQLGASERRLVDRRQPALILRAFKDDQIKVPGSLASAPQFSFLRFTKSSFEEMIAYEIEPIGPPIIIGEPGERLPRLGASREYLAGQDWKTVVRKVMQETAVSIFVLGDTENLHWEFQTAGAQCGRNRILILVPPLKDKQALGSRWQRFVEANNELLGPRFPTQFPEKPALAAFFVGEEPLLIVSERAAVWHGTLAIRLFVRLYRENLASLGQMVRFLEGLVPSAVADLRT
jgi:hypothetical protein